MATITRESVLDALRTVDDPDLKRDLVTLGMIRDLEVSDAGAVSLRVVLTTPACPMKEKIKSDVMAALAAIGATDPAIKMDAEVRRAPGMGTGNQAAERLPGVKSIIAVGSGKGGVGKSTVAANLALSLARSGASVGLLDADIYGPSLPTMFGLQNERPGVTEDGKTILPITRYGLKVMSMGFMIKADQAVVWRGPMLGKALQQFIEDVDWGDLDYLIIDMPPGTGDVALSLAQLVPVSGAVVVTTPQDVAFADVRRAIKMFEQVKQPLLGIVENMSHFVCGGCGADHEIFGHSRIDEHAAAHSMDVLGRLPLDSVTALAADKGQPIVVASPDGEQSKLYAGIAEMVAQKLAVAAHTTEDPKKKFSKFFSIAGS